jgi:hypothetical protein
MVVHHHDGDLHAGQQVDEVVVEVIGLEVGMLQLLVNGGQFLVGGLQLLLGGLQLLVGALQFFVGGLDFLVGGFEFPRSSLPALDDGMPRFAGALQFLAKRTTSASSGSRGFAGAAEAVPPRLARRGLHRPALLE